MDARAQQRHDRPLRLNGLHSSGHPQRARRAAKTHPCRSETHSSVAAGNPATGSSRVASGRRPSSSQSTWSDKPPLGRLAPPGSGPVTGMGIPRPQIRSPQRTGGNSQTTPMASTPRSEDHRGEKSSLSGFKAGQNLTTGFNKDRIGQCRAPWAGSDTIRIGTMGAQKYICIAAIFDTNRSQAAM